MSIVELNLDCIPLITTVWWVGQLRMSGSVTSHTCCNTLDCCSAWTLYLQLPMAGACIKEEETKDNRRKLGAHYHRAAVHRHKLATTTILIEHGLLNMIAIPRMTAIKEIVDVFVLPKTLN